MDANFNPPILRTDDGFIVEGDRFWLVDELYDEFTTDSLSNYDNHGRWAYEGTSEWIEPPDYSGINNIRLKDLFFGPRSTCGGLYSVGSHQHR